MYRGPDRARMQRAYVDIFKHAGHTAIWRQWVSAVSGNADAGLGATDYYREQTITAVISPLAPLGERVMALGTLLSGDVQIATREQLGARDEIIWRGKTYRVESEPVRALMDVCINTLKVGD